MMKEIQNGYLARYMEQNTLFSRTVVVKFKEAAELTNEGLVAKYGRDIVDGTRPETWKYYLNLSGQYHVTDRPMSVVSIDTLAPIDFTRENLKIHTATASAYGYGTRHYHTLVSQYPEQEGLINGILYPADINKAIDAENGTILSYPEGLIEDNEVTLILELENYIKNVMHRWHNVQFAMSDNLYCAAFFTQLHLFILPKLLNLRLKRCKTPEAHSFHVRMYLTSHGGLDRYLPYLTKKQSLWLYRNICYLERNPGKANQFSKLIDKLLTERGIPIGEYSLRHIESFDDNYRPSAVARLKMLNDGLNTSTTTHHSTDILFNKERQIAPGNPLYLDTYQERDTLRLRDTGSSVMQTKVLDSTMIDYSNAVPEPFEVVATRQWCYMANSGNYDVVVSYKDPKTADRRTLFAKDAFFYMQYVLLMSEGIEVTTIPEYLNLQRRRNPKPTVDDLMSVVPAEKTYLRAIAEEILSRQPITAPCHSVSSFYEQVDKLTKEAYWHWFLISNTEDLFDRALVENMVKRLYEDIRMNYDVAGPTIADFLEFHNLEPYDYDLYEAKALAKSLFEAATGLVIDQSRVLKNIQKAMIGLTTELSSYSIQFVREINESDILLINWPAVRLGNVRMAQSTARTIDNGVLVLEDRCHGASLLQLRTETDTLSYIDSHSAQSEKKVQVDPTPLLVTSVVSGSVCSDTASPMETAVSYTGQDVELESKTGVLGYTKYAGLPEILQGRVKSKYS